MKSLLRYIFTFVRDITLKFATFANFKSLLLNTEIRILEEFFNKAIRENDVPKSPDSWLYKIDTWFGIQPPLPDSVWKRILL